MILILNLYSRFDKYSFKINYSIKYLEIFQHIFDSINKNSKIIDQTINFHLYFETFPNSKFHKIRIIFFERNSLSKSDENRNSPQKEKKRGERNQKEISDDEWK